ncbi:MAG: sulfatase-like hydrolase/transferase [Phycisphaerales bacterium]|jgi:arylsulfatase A-like enzyme|nr:sulfatase-like hydrolase/transferase [Phycisphaerales bacterium]
MIRLLAIVVGLIPMSPAVADDPKSPNVILFVSDDHRADVLGCAGHPIVQTPNIDRLAAKGVRFENAFVTTSICAASRASILTGLPERSHQFTFGRPPLSAALAESTYPAILRDSGYHTAFIGKLGISISGGRASIDAMFDEFTPLSRSPYFKTLQDGTSRHVTDITGDEAVAFIRRQSKEKPFCLSVSFNAGHAEDGDLEDHYPPPSDEAGLHAGVTMPRPRLDDASIFEAQPPFLRKSMNRDRYHWRWDEPEKYDRNLRGYFQMLASLDRNIGRVLEALELRGLAEDTIVIFIGDNGYYMGERGFAGKWSHYEESLRVPLVVFDPRLPKSSAGRVLTETALNIDLAPTILDVAGAGTTGSGTSLAGAMRDEGGPARTGFFCEHGMKHPRIPRWEGYRTDRFKYVRYLDQPEDAEFLHDLQADPDELVNLATDPDRAELLERLRNACDEAVSKAVDRAAPLPRVLLLGDSISMGYHASVVAGLDDEATVVRPDENCEGTTKGIRRIADWLELDGGDFDVVHFNFGLHDLKRVDADRRNSDDPSDPPQADIETYERNLRSIARTILASGATPVFCTTTPVPEGGVRPHRDPADVDLYNRIARTVMAELGIRVNDLHSFAAERLEDIQRPVNVHFNRPGSIALGGRVTGNIRKTLRAGR